MTTATIARADAPTTSAEWIPNINLGEDYDRRYVDSPIHYDALGNLAEFFGRDMPVHRHAQYLQIHYIERDRINFHIDDKLFQVHGPALFLTPPAVPHSFQTSVDTGGHVLTIHQSLVWQLLSGGLQNAVDTRYEEGMCLARENLDAEMQEQWANTLRILLQIRAEWQSHYPGRPQALEYLVYILLIQIARLGHNRATSTAVVNDDLRLFHKFTAQVEQHFREHWRLSRYTEAIGVSESRLNQICQRISNSSPKRIIQDRMLQEVKRMLIFGRLSINEIAYELGFTDPAYFSRFFKTQTGSSPLNYRRSQGQR